MVSGKRNDVIVWTHDKWGSDVNDVMQRAILCERSLTTNLAELCTAQSHSQYCRKWKVAAKPIQTQISLYVIAGTWGSLKWMRKVNSMEAKRTGRSFSLELKNPALSKHVGQSNTHTHTRTHTHTHTHARSHARTHARTHAHAHKGEGYCSESWLGQ